MQLMGGSPKNQQKQNRRGGNQQNRGGKPVSRGKSPQQQRVKSPPKTASLPGAKP